METILIADKQVLVRQGIRRIIGEFPQQYVVIEATTGEAVRHLLSTQSVQYAIVDMVLADGHAFLTAIPLWQFGDRTGILVYSAKPERLYAPRLLQKGIRGYVGKRASLTDLQEAIETLLRQDIYISPQLRELQVNAGHATGNPLHTLSPRELLVTEYIITGRTAADVARELAVDETTISTYRKRIFRKLDVTNILELREAYLWYKMP